MDEESPLESGDLPDSYQQPPISGSGGLYMVYIGGSNWLVPIMDETLPGGLDGEVLSDVAQVVEQGVPPSFKEQDPR